MSQFSFYDKFIQFVVDKFPRSADGDPSKLWSVFGKLFYEDVFRNRGVSTNLRNTSDGDVITSLRSGDISIKFLRWLECHAYLGQWKTFQEAAEELAGKYNESNLDDWATTDSVASELVNNTIAGEHHCKFLEVALKEGYVPVAYLLCDVLKGGIRTADDVVSEDTDSDESSGITVLYDDGRLCFTNKDSAIKLRMPERAAALFLDELYATITDMTRHGMNYNQYRVVYDYKFRGDRIVITVYTEGLSACISTKYHEHLINMKMSVNNLRNKLYN